MFLPVGLKARGREQLSPQPACWGSCCSYPSFCILSGNGWEWGASTGEMGPSYLDHPTPQTISALSGDLGIKKKIPLWLSRLKIYVASLIPLTTLYSFLIPLCSPATERPAQSIFMCPSLAAATCRQSWLPNSLMTIEIFTGACIGGPLFFPGSRGRADHVMQGLIKPLR